MGVRPLAARKAQASEAPENPADDQVIETPANEPLDGAVQSEALSRTGQITQGDDEFSQRVAKRLGWTTQEEWTRDPAQWRDHRQFLEQMPDQFDALRERSRRAEDSAKRMTAAAAEAIEETRRQARIEAQAEIRAAAESQDPERAEQAAKRLAEIPSGPPPQTLAWMTRNPWFDADPVAQALAVTIVNQRAKAGASIEDQLEAAEAEVRKRYPEHFPELQARRDPEKEVRPPAVAEREVRLSESRRVAPAVSEGTRGGGGAPKEKGYADVPPTDRHIFESKLLSKFRGRGLSEQDAKTHWAKAYWRERG